MLDAAGHRRKEALKKVHTSEDEKRFRIDATLLPFHSDQGATDLIALVSLAKAKSGGESKWVSGIAIHNELLRRGRKVCCTPGVCTVLPSCCMACMTRQGNQTVPSAGLITSNTPLH